MGWYPAVEDRSCVELTRDGMEYEEVYCIYPWAKSFYFKWVLRITCSLPTLMCFWFTLFCSPRTFFCWLTLIMLRLKIIISAGNWLGAPRVCTTLYTSNAGSPLLALWCTSWPFTTDKNTLNRDRLGTWRVLWHFGTYLSVSLVSLDSGGVYPLWCTI